MIFERRSFKKSENEQDMIDTAGNEVKLHSFLTLTVDEGD